jgi:saccharopine dehydrogenase-like NADP-dependent oxidoreductase
MKTILLGAGHIGQTIARQLAATGDYAITVADRSAAALKPLAAAGLRTVLMDEAAGTPEDTAQALQALLKGHETVVNALPYDCAIAVAEAARAAGCHCFDLTEDVAATRRIRELADGAPTAFMPQCGLAPGFVGIVAHDLASSFDDIFDLKMRVGALPAFPTNALKYNLTWSVDGLINEYCHPCEAIRDGQRLELLPLEGLEHFSMDGAAYEAFNTSGGLGTLCETLAGRARNLDYKSVRYPGHCALVKVLLDDLSLKHDAPTLKRILQRAVPSTLQDVVLVLVTVRGLSAGRFVEKVFARKIYAKPDGPTPLSAIQITTAAGLCGVLDLFREGRLAPRGFIRQESVPLADFLANRFGQAFEQLTPVSCAS